MDHQEDGFLTSVGIIANPASGKDIRRVVAGGFVVTNQEKANIVQRLLTALDQLGIDEALVMPDTTGLSARILTNAEFDHLNVRHVDLPYVLGNADDSTRAAEAMRAEGVGCIVTLGGDGTNRVVALGCGDVPIIPVSTGTNNVFPEMIEGTLAGMAAAAVALGACVSTKAIWRAPLLELLKESKVIDVALIDLVVLDGLDTGSRAVWDPLDIRELFLTRSSPNSVGMSSIGASLEPLRKDSGKGLHIRTGKEGQTILAPIAPGLLCPLTIEEFHSFAIGEDRKIGHMPCVIALDGEREVVISEPGDYQVRLSKLGPRVVDVDIALNEAARRGFFRPVQPSHLQTTSNNSLEKLNVS